MGQTDVCVFTRWLHFCMKWRHDIHIEIKLSFQKSDSSQFDVHFLEEQSLPNSSGRGHPNKNNKMKSDMRSVPDLKVTHSSLFPHVDDLHFCLLFDCSQLAAVTAVDGLKLKNRAARFANTLGSSESPKVRMEPLTLTRQNVSLIMVLSLSVVNTSRSKM